MRVEEWYERSYEELGANAQRRYPNEEFLRFVGRSIGSMSREEKETLTALEVGCGSGGNLWVFAEQGCKTIGLDISKKGIEYAKEYLNSRELKAEFVCESMTNMSRIDDRSIDLVADIFSSNCLTIDEHKMFLKEIKRIMKETGKYFLYTPGKESDAFKNYYPAKLIDESTLNGIYRESSPYVGNSYNFRFDKIEEIEQRLNDVNLKMCYKERVTRTYRNGTEIFEFHTAEVVHS